MKAYLQYQNSYRKLFTLINKLDIPYLINSLEGLILDKDKYIKSIHKFLNFNIEEIELNTKSFINEKRYKIFGIK